MSQNHNPQAAQISGDIINIHEGGAAVIRGNTVSIRDGGAMLISANSVSVNDGGALVVLAEHAEFQDTRVFLLAAGQVSGNVKVMIDLKAAAAFGLLVGLGIAAFKLLGRRD